MIITILADIDRIMSYLLMLNMVNDNVISLHLCFSYIANFSVGLLSDDKPSGKL